MPQVSWYVAAASLFFLFRSSIWPDTAFLFLSDCSASAFLDSSRYKLYFCHYLHFSLLVYWKASFYSCLIVWKNKQHSTTCCTCLCQPWPHATTLDLTWSKFTKRSHSLSIMEAAYSECWNNHQCNEHLIFPGHQSHFPWLFQTFPYLTSFSMIFQTRKISTLDSMTFQTFPGSVWTLYCIYWSVKMNN